MIRVQRSPVIKHAQDRFGKRPSPASVWRWIHQGAYGVKLQAVFFAGRWQCSEDEFDAFVAGQTAAVLDSDATSDETPDRSPETTAKLRAAGVL